MSFTLNVPFFLFDVTVSPVSGDNLVACGVGVGFFLLLAAVAAVVFFFIKRTVRMAIRMAIVAAILVIALVGGVSLWMFTASKSKPAPRPNNPRNR